ncbi:alpha/beta hydrolase [Sphingomonas sp. JC676]|uniref:alpha/beta fold hydrolase n=1 Tax=Sphingomonas sp. JC676 TaxID=2768065 RepID=UPI0016582FC0|nr:alpha/beta hydrolase [Sphingomonas sp. JC676]MBC9033782.1 alpha/beta hydrolase [Sphingomonas sp. JC676]
MLQQDLQPKADIGEFVIDATITLRRMVVQHPEPRGTVLLLHGFPETLYAYKDIALALGADYEVHAFDWPGHGFSSRPAVENFSYAPADYARILRAYIDRAGIDRSTLTIYATDISGLPALLAALDEPGIARVIVVGDFAPLNRPAHMWENLQALKAEPAATRVRAFMNANRDEILANTFTRGLPAEAHYEVAPEFRDDAKLGWDHGTMTSVDAFYHYYSHFSAAQEHLDARLDEVATPVRVLWGADDMYISRDMGIELAERLGAELTLLPGVGHYAHLQAPARVIEVIRAAAR